MKMYCFKSGKNAFVKEYINQNEIVLTLNPNEALFLSQNKFSKDFLESFDLRVCELETKKEA